MKLLRRFRATAEPVPGASGGDLLGSALRFAYGSRMERGLESGSADPAVVHPSELAFATYLDRAFNEDEEASFERHVAFCSRCALELSLARRSGAGKSPRSGFASRRTWQIAAGMVLAAGSLLAALIAGRAASSRIEAELLALLRDRIGADASVDSVSLVWRGPNGIAPGVRLDSVRVAGDPAFGTDPLVSASRASVHFDLGALRQGNLRGQVVLDRPQLNVVRDGSGRVNLDAILPGGLGPNDIFAEARRRSISGVRIADGTIRWAERRSGGSSEVKLTDVDASIDDLDRAGPARVDLRAGLASAVHNVAASGQIVEGPGGPRYQFSSVELRSIAMASIPDLGQELRGHLDFDGSVESQGASWAALSASMTARGSAVIQGGALAGHNLLRDLVPATPAENTGGDLAPRSKALLAAADTSFERMGTSVALTSGRFELAGISVSGDGWQATGAGSLTVGGDVGFNGRLVISPEVTREVVAVVAVASTLVDDAGRLTIPFRMTGNWPAVQVAVDGDKLATDALRRARSSRFARLWFVGPLG